MGVAAVIARRAAGAPLARLGRRGHGRRRRDPAGPAVRDAAGGAARLDPAVVLHQRLELPDRARRRAHPRRAEPVRRRTTAPRRWPASTTSTARCRAPASSGRSSTRSRTSPAWPPSARPGACCPTPSTTSASCSRCARSAPARRALLFPGPLHWRLIGRRDPGHEPDRGAHGVVLACPTRPCCCCSWPPSGSCCAAASAGPAWRSPAPILLKQFAIVAIPFLALLVWQRADPEQRRRAAIGFGAVLARRLPAVPRSGAPSTCGATPSPTAPRATRSSAGASPRPCSRPASSTTRTTPTRSPSWPLLVWAPATAYLVWAQRRLGTAWAPGGRLRLLDPAAVLPGPRLPGPLRGLHAGRAGGRRALGPGLARRRERAARPARASMAQASGSSNTA